MANFLRPFLTIPSLVLVAALSAQTVTDQYIELTVTDTMSMKVKRITYSFTPQGAEMYSDAVRGERGLGEDPEEGAGRSQGES